MKAHNKQLKFFTIPNILTLFRIVLIPVFVYTYLVKKNTLHTIIIIIISGLSDVADGFIARRFNMVSDIGKALDPLADKLTQAALLYCLIARFPNMLYVFILLVIKELILSLLSFLAIKKTHIVKGADWHGKMTTVLLYTMMMIHIIYADISPKLSNTLIIICVISMILSFILYAIRHIKAFTHKE